MHDKTKLLLIRTFNFGVDVLRFIKLLPPDFIYRIPQSQLGRAATSIGANYEEAQGAVSKRDFNHKIALCYKESRESGYWLRILKELYQEEAFKSGFTLLISENSELTKIFASIKKKSSAI
jgi:four helix bundle protein